MGVPDDTIQSAYSTLNAFTKLSLAPVQAEFPEWELLQAFHIFDLRDIPTPKDRSLGLRRLANVFSLPPDQLLYEYNALLPAAQRVRIAGDPNIDCWRAAWKGRQLQQGDWAAITGLLVLQGFKQILWVAE